MPITKKKRHRLALFSLLSTLLSKLKTLITESEEQDDDLIYNIIYIHILIYIYIKDYEFNFSYQHWSVSQFLLVYPENPDIAVAMAADEAA